MQRKAKSDPSDAGNNEIDAEEHTEDIYAVDWPMRQDDEAK